MSAPIRFLGLAIIAYVGLRTASSALALQPTEPGAAPAPAVEERLAEATLPPGVPADMGSPPAEPYHYAAQPGPYGPVPPGAYGYPQAPAYPTAAYPYAAAGMAVPYPVMMAAAYAPPRASRPIYHPVPYPVPMPAYAPAAPAPRADAALALSTEDPGAGLSGYGQPVPPLEQWPAVGTIGSAALGATQVTPRWEAGTRGRREQLPGAAAQRWSVDAWALLRPPSEGVYRLDGSGAVLNPGLASAGSLGGSQAGIRISWKPLSQIGVHLRASTALMPQGRSARSQAMAGGEGALGVSWQPLRSLPVRLLAERRQRLGPALGGGRDAFALLGEGGVSDQALPFGFTLDGYGQAGVIGANRRDLFADGALAATYPFMPRFAIGGGMWGGIQPGLSRFDAGPRLSYQLRPGLRAHLDYRFRVTGSADPASGPAFTLAAGF